MSRESTRMAWTSLDGRIDNLARFGRRLSEASIARLGDPTWRVSDGTVHHVTIIQTRWRTRRYLDGKRVRRWHAVPTRDPSQCPSAEVARAVMYQPANSPLLVVTNLPGAPK